MDKESNSYPLEKQGTKLFLTLLKELDSMSPCVDAQKVFQSLKLSQETQLMLYKDPHPTLT